MKGKIMLRILIAVCLLSLSRSDQFSSLLRTVIDGNEVSQQISGPNGYCMDVERANYQDGTPIILWSCATAPGINQLWTFESDGTLRSNGKCLTTDGFTQRSNIVIHNCDTAARDATIWQQQSNGEIINPASGKVITAIFATLSTQLTLQRTIFSSFQKWRVDNDTNPNLATIIGMDGLCLQLEDNVVWVGECESSHLGQRWLFYQDGTIRPQQNQNGCLGFDNLPNRQIIVFTCGHGGSSQRWLYTDSGTILNERLDLVFDVSESNPSLKKIIVFPATGKPNQKWDVIFHSRYAI